jgi:RNA polymerase sigma-70 factor (ECF subfamily)
MSKASQSDQLLVRRVRGGDAQAWEELIGRYEGRLLAFVESRTRNRATSEDIVQETFIGLLTSLPNYDENRPLETYLFSIATYKLTDHLRRQGRRPTIPLTPPTSESGSADLPGSARGASSLVRSGERRRLEEEALLDAMRSQIDHWRQRGDWPKIQCAELIMVRGLGNKDAAAALGVSEQSVANWKYEFLTGLRKQLRRQHLPLEVFPELYDSP